ncbi:GntR family transcriptional regulator [Nocardiopsis kunsanensis]|uniref:GntR family transcriptional regulator n=1 Tax=Nocardiopsis kunsanensis TaxID=141693 RepID=A0A918XLQ2_9ACTN|nr:GntR family transcriptional regulator [Nocardiopsis kunsanensis]GHD37751.1 GntR family transcriptional regulator [Nocardiopsis kunsanensis]
MEEKIQVSPPPYLQIADRYRHLISIGRMRAGDRLPTLAQVATDFHVSPRTANKAFRLLAAEGVIETTQQGSRVSQGSVRQTRESVAPRFGPATRDTVTITSAAVVPTPEIVAQTLATNEHEVIRREAVTERDGQPYTFEVVWMPATEALCSSHPELLEEEPIPAILRVVAPPEVDYVAGADWLVARTVETEREAAGLGLELGAPTLAGASIWSLKSGPILYREWMAPAGEQVLYEYSQSVR